MALFKKSFEKNVTRDNEFLKDYAVKCNSLALYAGDNETVKKEIELLKDDFQYTVATNIRDAKAVEKKIANDFSALMALLQQPEWDETQVLLALKGIRAYIIEISSLR